MNKQELHIAIDGQVASGKDVVGAALASRLDCSFIESGTIYRAAAWEILNQNIDISDPAKTSAAIEHMSLQISNEIKNKEVIFGVAVNNCDISDQLRTNEIDLASSLIARQPHTRKLLIDLKKKMARDYPRLIMTGRGIGRMVLPDADLKTYLTASLDVRAHRRHLQKEIANPDITFAEVKNDIEKRDDMNRNRSFDPDIPTDDSVIIDTSLLTIPQVCDQIEDLLEKISNQKTRVTR